MRIVVLVTMLHASVFGFPSPDVRQPSELRSGPEPGLGGWNDAAAAVS